jgi:hypothetical protein
MTRGFVTARALGIGPALVRGFASRGDRVERPVAMAAVAGGDADDAARAGCADKVSMRASVILEDAAPMVLSMVLKGAANIPAKAAIAVYAHPERRAS